MELEISNLLYFQIKYLINKGKIVKAKMDKEYAEAKAKEAAEKAEAEKEAKKKANETEGSTNETLDKDSEYVIPEEPNIEENVIRGWYYFVTKS